MKLKTEIQFAKVVEVFSPGAWRRSEADVARSAAGRGSDHTPESGTQSPTVGETEMGLQTFEKHKPLICTLYFTLIKYACLSFLYAF